MLFAIRTIMVLDALFIFAACNVSGRESDRERMEEIRDHEIRT